MLGANRCYVSVHGQVTCATYVQELSEELPVPLGGIRRLYRRESQPLGDDPVACFAPNGRSTIRGFVVSRTHANRDTHGSPTRTPPFRLSPSHALAALCCADSA